MENKKFVVIATAGSVDDGKSTLIGRLLYDCDYIYKDVLKTLKKDYESEDVVVDNLAYLTDGLEAEREQGITIDVAYRHFSYKDRKFLLADVPGHEQYTRNMITGVSRADTVIIMIDALSGVSIQTKRHFYIAYTLGVKNIIFAINKMDLIDYDEKVFNKIKDDINLYSTKLNVSNHIFIPMSAKFGDMVAIRGLNMIWYKGPTLLEVLESSPLELDSESFNLRFPIQYVVNDTNIRGYSGRIEEGFLNVGDEIMVIPSNKKTHVKDIYIGFDKVESCFKKQSVLISTTDKIDISRGDLIIGINDSMIESNNLNTMIFWFNDEPLFEGRNIILKNGTKEIRGVVQNIEYVIDMNTGNKIENLKKLDQNDFGKVSIKLNSNIFFDDYTKNKDTGSFILIDDINYNTIGAGLILKDK